MGRFGLMEFGAEGEVGAAGESGAAAHEWQSEYASAEGAEASEAVTSAQRTPRRDAGEMAGKATGGGGGGGPPPPGGPGSTGLPSKRSGWQLANGPGWAVGLAGLGVGVGAAGAGIGAGKGLQRGISSLFGANPDPGSPPSPTGSLFSPIVILGLGALAVFLVVKMK